MTLKKIVHCARCGEDHLNLTAKPLTRPVMDYSNNQEKVLYTHWVPCPVNGEPILVVEVDKDGSVSITTGDAS